MPNSISQDQNAPLQLQRLAAQRRIYTDAKLLRGVRVILTVPMSIAWSVVATLYAPLKIWAALWGLIVAIIDAAVLEPVQSHKKDTAAKIQELFDCDVLHLSRNDFKLANAPDQELIIAADQRLTKKDKLGDWYPKSVSILDLAPARLVCQRTNLRWDASLRRKYVAWTLGILSGLCVPALVLAVAYNFTLENFVLSFLAPVAPAILWMIREHRQQNDAATTSERLKARIETLWPTLLANKIDPAELESTARRLQDEIFERRRNAPVIFNWIYWLLRDKYEDHANRASEQLVTEAVRALGAATSGVPTEQRPGG